MNDVETLELAQRLVRIDSVNPSLVPGAAGEAALAHFVAGVLENRDVDVELRDALPGRPNVIGRILSLVNTRRPLKSRTYIPLEFRA